MGKEIQKMTLLKPGKERTGKTYENEGSWDRKVPVLLTFGCKIWTTTEHKERQ